MSLNYTPWDHYREDKSNSAPVTGADPEGLIIGLELEIAEVYDYDGFNEMISAGYLETADSERANIQLEYEAQSDVELECVFNADTPQNILRRVQTLNSFISGDFTNHRQTSAHIHINRRYLNNQGIDAIDFYKAAESIAPIIYKVSGRDSHSWNRWTTSNISPSQGFMSRFKEIDAIEPRTAEDWGGDARYEMCNMQNSKTIEIRGFSNYYENSEALIELYINIVTDLIPTIAIAMRGKTYKEDYETVLKITADFLEANPKATEYAPVLNDWKNWKELARIEKRRAYNDAIEKYRRTIGILNDARDEARRYNKIRAARCVLEALEYNEELKLDSLNLSDLIPSINNLEEQTQKLFKNTIWRL